MKQYVNCGLSQNLEITPCLVLVGDGTANERAEMKEKRSASDLKVRSYAYIEGLDLNLVDATENEYGDGVGKGGCEAGEFRVVEGEAPDIIL